MAVPKAAIALLAVAGTGYAQDDACHSAHSSEADCVKDSKCSWCKSAAVPSSCATKENAKKLPPGVFDCSGTEEKPRRRSELLSTAVQESMGIKVRGNLTDSHDKILLGPKDMPADFTWCDKDGKSYCTMSRNQHIPQYCGSCWAHGAVSALGDRIKIARGGKGVDINLAVQHVLNCGGVGTCKGGSIDGVYQWVHQISKDTGSGIAYETGQPYLACSSDSDDGFCGHVDTSCNALNTARTCGSFAAEGGPCTGLVSYPNATISDYGSISGKAAMQKEIMSRGPIACGIDAMPLLNYESGVIKEKGDQIDHVISVTGWGTDPTEGFYWQVRNSWGEYWGEMGYVRVGEGALHVEDQCSWAVPAEFTAAEKLNQVHCHEGGDNCKASKVEKQVVV